MTLLNYLRILFEHKKSILSSSKHQRVFPVQKSISWVVQRMSIEEFSNPRRSNRLSLLYYFLAMYYDACWTMNIWTIRNKIRNRIIRKKFNNLLLSAPPINLIASLLVAAREHSKENLWQPIELDAYQLLKIFRRIITERSRISKPQNIMSMINTVSTHWISFFLNLHIRKRMLNVYSKQ